MMSSTVQIAEYLLTAAGFALVVVGGVWAWSPSPDGGPLGLDVMVQSPWVQAGGCLIGVGVTLTWSVPMAVVAAVYLAAMWTATRLLRASFGGER